MKTQLQSNIINNFLMFDESGIEISDLDINLQEAYKCFKEVILNIDEKYHNCVGCPVLRGSYLLEVKKEMIENEMLWSKDQEDCIYGEMNCVMAIQEIDSIVPSAYNKLLRLAGALER